jgi:integrase
MAAATGMREGELLGLKWGDVDTKRGVLRVQRSLSVVGGQMHEREAKARSARTVPLSQVAAAALEQQRRRWREVCGREPGPDDYVFVREDGRPGTPSWLRHRFGKVRDAVGLTSLRFHDLRHMVASVLLAQGASVRAVAEVLGHRVPSTTLNVYSHVLVGGTREVVALLDDLLLRRRQHGRDDG